MSKALIKFIRLSPTKARLIARQVQGMNAELAMASLKFMPNKAAKYIANAVSSAVANGGFEANEVQVLSCRVDAGAVLKRFQPRARGSASRIRKPTSHILVEVGKAGEKTEMQKLAEQKKAQAKKAQVKTQAKTEAKKEVKKEIKEQPKKAQTKTEKPQKSATANKEVKEVKKETKPKTTSAKSTTKSTAKKTSPKKTEKEA